MRPMRPLQRFSVVVRKGQGKVTIIHQRSTPVDALHALQKAQARLDRDTHIWVWHAYVRDGKTVRDTLTARELLTMCGLPPAAR